MQSPPQLTGIISRRPLLILSLSILLTLLLASGIPKLTMRPFLEDDLPPSDPILAASEKYSAVFGKGDFAYLALVGDTIYRPSTLAKVAAITDELNALEARAEEQRRCVSSYVTLLVLEELGEAGP